MSHGVQLHRLAACSSSHPLLTTESVVNACGAASIRVEMQLQKTRYLLQTAMRVLEA